MGILILAPHLQTRNKIHLICSNQKKNKSFKIFGEMIEFSKFTL